MNLRQRWDDAIALFDRTRRLSPVDLLIAVGLAGFLYGLIHFGQQASEELRPAVEIDLSPWALPRYTFFSLLRGLVAYVLSLTFTLVYGYWAAKDKVADRVLVPMLDILQSIPVLGFMPGLVLALVYLFPKSNLGLEMAAVLMIFTGQAWNMTFSFYHSVRSVPQDQREVATTYRFNWWQLFYWVELPYSTMGLVWNSMMSMAGGWFFLITSEAFQLGDQDFRLPGIGSYMSVASDTHDYSAQICAIIAMTLMIVGLDQFLWRPVVVWAQKFRVEEGGFQVAQNSWFLTFLRRSRMVQWVVSRFERRSAPVTDVPKATDPKAELVDPTKPLVWASWLSLIFFLALLVGLTIGAWHLLALLWEVPLGDWANIGGAAGVTLTRVLISTAVGTLWAVPAGLAIGLSPRLSTLMQPVVQVVASFPAPMLFPMVLTALNVFGVPLGLGSIFLMLLGTQWYILFNVIAGAMAIPADLKEAAHSYNITGWQKFWALYFPAIFPFLVTGWVTAAGGAWNASIVSEYVTYDKQVFETWGLGALISNYSYKKNFPLLAASILVMSAVVVAFNRTVWRYCYHLAEKRYSLTK